MDNPSLDAATLRSIAQEMGDVLAHYAKRKVVPLTTDERQMVARLEMWRKRLLDAHAEAAAPRPVAAQEKCGARYRGSLCARPQFCQKSPGHRGAHEADEMMWVDEAQGATPPPPPAEAREMTTWRADVDPELPPLAQVAEALRQKADYEQWARWLKDGETPLERIEREHRDNQTLLRELAKAKTEAAALTAQVQALTEERNEAREAYGYLSRLFKSIAPQCEPMPDLLGLATQIDNAFVYVREQERQQAIAVVEQLRVHECYTGHHLNRAGVIAALRAKSEKGDGT